jgi:hypothetical protein
MFHYAFDYLKIYFVKIIKNNTDKLFKFSNCHFDQPSILILSFSDRNITYGTQTISLFGKSIFSILHNTFVHTLHSINPFFRSQTTVMISFSLMI